MAKDCALEPTKFWSNIPLDFNSLKLWLRFKARARPPKILPPPMFAGTEQDDVSDLMEMAFWKEKLKEFEMQGQQAST